MFLTSFTASKSRHQKHYLVISIKALLFFFGIFVCCLSFLILLVYCFFCMVAKIVSSVEVFSKFFPDFNLEQNTLVRARALRHYFAEGGVISVNEKSKGWPELVYPSVQRLEAQISAFLLLKKNFEKEKVLWEKKLLNENLYHLKHNFFKFSEPVYWKHFVNSLANSDYRHDSMQVNLPAHLVSDKRWRPMIEMFVNNIEYRKQLVETVQQGLVYKNSKKVGKYANDLRDFRIEVSQKKINYLKQKIQEIGQQIKTFQEMLVWAKEKK